VVAGLAVKQTGFQNPSFACFLQHIEARYHTINENAYHNSMHGADVVNSMTYFLRILAADRVGAPFGLEPVETLAALVAAGCHDVGHNGKSNRFHQNAETPLALLYNDLSVLENMHCTVTFSVLQIEPANFTSDMEAPQRTTFRSLVTQMILETDLAKHVQVVSRFRQEYVNAKPALPLSPAQRKDLLSFILKGCDVAHSTKPFDLHAVWTLRINAEFFEQGDTEKALGIPCSPFCDRHGTQVAESQKGFFQFIVQPLYTAMYEYLESRRLELEVLPEIEKNEAFWNHYDGTDFNYNDPLVNLKMIKEAFGQWHRDRRLGNATKNVLRRRTTRAMTTMDFGRRPSQVTEE
jgi:hypothetical protein